LVSEQPLNGVSPASFDTEPFFTNVMVLAVKAADIGLGALGGNVNFLVQTTSADVVESEGEYIDRSPLMRYDPARPAVRFSAPTALAPAYLDQPGTTIEVTADPAGYSANPPAGILVFHHHNRSGSRTSVVNVNLRWPTTIYLPIVDQGATP
jgi:hypothetical protein